MGKVTFSGKAYFLASYHIHLSVPETVSDALVNVLV